MEMRVAFAEGLRKLMETDPRVMVVDADLARANGTLSLRQQFPDRALDVGVAEQNMAGIAAGLASQGFIPFITSFSTFASRRICDQVAISIAYAGRNVKVVGSDPGVSAEMNGGTHMGIEDMAVLRSIPTMVIFEPSDPGQLTQAMPQLVAHDGPVYLRLHRKEVEDIHGPGYKFNLFKADVLREGADVTIVATGVTMVREALAAAELLAGQGIAAEVLEMHTIKPVDTETLLASASKTGAVVTAENHSWIGGLRSAVLEALSEDCPVPVLGVGFRDVFGEVGHTAELMKKHKMTAADIAARAKEAISKKEALKGGKTA